MNPADKEAGKSKIVGMGRFCAPTVFLVTAALAVGEKFPGEISGGVGDGAKAGDSGGAKLISTDAPTPCDGVMVSLEGKVKAVEMEEFNISLTVSSSSEASR